MVVFLSGNCAWELTTLLKSFGKEWSIQDGMVQVLDKDAALAGTAVFLSEETGMINSPTLNSKRRKLKASMLLAPDVFPGRLMVLKSRHINGNFRIEKCTYVGDTHGDDWTIDVEAKKLGL